MEERLISRRRLIRNAALGAALLGAPTVLSACGSRGATGASPSTGGPGTHLTVWSVKDPQHSAQLVYAVEKGLFAAEGLQVEPRYIVNGPDLPSLAAGGQIELMSATVEMVASLREKGVDFTYLMKLSEISNTQGFVLAPNSPVRTPQDLAGRSVGMYAGAAVALAVENMCRAEGVDYGAIRFRNLEPPEQMTALARGEIDAMACWEPYIGAGTASGGTLYFTGNRSFIHGTETPVDWLYLTTGLTASAAFLQRSPDVVTRVMRALIKATAEINADLDAAADVIAGPLDVRPDELARILKANSYDQVIDSRFRDGWTQYLAWAAAPQQRYLTRVWTPDQLTDFTLVSSVDPTLVEAGG